MTSVFNDEERRFVHAWAIEDHLGQQGPARSLQRAHGVNAAVMGQLVARLATALDRTQQDLVEEQGPEEPIAWPWKPPLAFESRLEELLPTSALQYLEDIGALRRKVGSK